MRSFKLLLISLFVFKILSAQRHSIEIPEIKDHNKDSKYPDRSILASYTNSFEILISLKSYSAWGPDNSIKILAHHNSGWYKIEIATDPSGYDPYKVCLTTAKIKDSIGDEIWKVLLENHLFDMNDERTKAMDPCCPIVDTIVENGEKQVIYSFSDISDGGEFEFEILTKDKYKKLYFYEPEYKFNYCPEFIERKLFNNCIIFFQKHLGT